MRKKIIISGIIVLIIGISLFIYGTNHYNTYKQYIEKGYLEIPNTINIANSEAEMAFGTTVSYIGIFTLFIGALLIAIGFFLKKN
jgi:uncharacterized membrane protein